MKQCLTVFGCISGVDYDIAVSRSTNSWDAAMALAPYFGLTKEDAANRLREHWYTSTKVANAIDFTKLRGEQQ